MKRVSFLLLALVLLVTGASFAKEDVKKPSMVSVSEQTIQPIQAIVPVVSNEDLLVTYVNHMEDLTDEVESLNDWPVDFRVESLQPGFKMAVFRPPVLI